MILAIFQPSFNKGQNSSAGLVPTYHWDQKQEKTFINFFNYYNLSLLFHPSRDTEKFTVEIIVNDFMTIPPHLFHIKIKNKWGIFILQTVCQGW